jgi:hypothetical protein
VTIEVRKLKDFLIDRARQGRAINYGGVLSHFGHAVHQANIQNLLKAPLKQVGEDCHRRGEPLLTVLVVAKSTGLPSRGFTADAVQFGILPASVATAAEEQAFIQAMTDRCFEHWTAASTAPACP